MKAPIVVLLLVLTSKVYAQKDTVYTLEYLDKSTRFAWLTYGADLNFQTGGTTQRLVNGSLEDVDFSSTFFPRLTIGGVHFWGHVDFYVSFPLTFLIFQSVPTGLDDLEIFQGIETGARFYPLKLQPGRVSPFIGISFRRMRFSQEAEESGFTNGTPNYGRFIYPIQFGLTYTTQKWHFTASGYYNYQNEFDYYVTPDQQAAVRLDPVSFNISFLRYLDSDRSMRSPQAVKQINEDYAALQQSGLLSAWFIGIGPSAALQSSKSDFLEENYPYFTDNYSAAILPDITFGRYFHIPDINVNLSYRTYGDSFEGFGSEITTRRHSVGIESVAFLFNYLGFVPFFGPIVSYEFLNTTVDDIEYSENKPAVGFTFGWDIRVTKTGTSLLRTNLRYYPGLHMDIEGEKMMFNHLEFNFIQWVQYFGRKDALRR